MSTDHSYEVYTLELGPYDTLAALHRDLSNHTSTFVNVMCQDEVVISISHSVVEVGGKLFASVVTTTDCNASQ